MHLCPNPYKPESSFSGWRIGERDDVLLFGGGLAFCSQNTPRPSLSPRTLAPQLASNRGELPLQVPARGVGPAWKPEPWARRAYFGFALCSEPRMGRGCACTNCKDKAGLWTVSCGRGSRAVGRRLGAGRAGADGWLSPGCVLQGECLHCPGLQFLHRKRRTFY